MASEPLDSTPAGAATSGPAMSELLQPKVMPLARSNIARTSTGSLFWVDRVWVDRVWVDRVSRKGAMGGFWCFWVVSVCVSVGGVLGGVLFVLMCRGGVKCLWFV